MEDLQFDERLSWTEKVLTGEFITNFIDPADLNVEDKIRFESLFDLLQEKPVNNQGVY